MGGEDCANGIRPEEAAVKALLVQKDNLSGLCPWAGPKPFRRIGDLHVAEKVRSEEAVDRTGQLVPHHRDARGRKAPRWSDVCPLPRDRCRDWTRSAETFDVEPVLVAVCQGYSAEVVDHVVIEER